MRNTIPEDGLFNCPACLAKKKLAMPVGELYIFYVDTTDSLIVNKVCSNWLCNSNIVAIQGHLAFVLHQPCAIDARLSLSRVKHPDATGGVP
jgi:hypothetical protein